MIIQTNLLCFIGETETEEVIFPFNQETQLVFSSVQSLSRVRLFASP